MEYSPAFLTVAWNIVFAAAGLSVLVSLWRRPSVARMVAGLAVLGMIGLGLALVANVLRGPFYSMRILAYLVFGHGPVLLAALTIISWKPSKGLATAAAAAAVAIVGVAVDAFWIEPTSLEVNEYTLRSKKIHRPIKMVVVADLQTDVIGDYERRALRTAMDQKGGLILFAGDYLQEYDPEKAPRLRAEFDSLLEEMKISAPLGVFAVRGNTEWGGWQASFDRLGFRTFETSGSVELGEFVLTGLSEADSFNPSCSDFGRELDPRRFHVVLGHSPNCALAKLTADLILCGHTHGGQVRLPGIGPLLTMSRIRRRWAAGMHEIGPGQTLLVSRGIGLERGDAPRLRFLCRPEIVVLNLMPESLRGSTPPLGNSD